MADTHPSFPRRELLAGAGALSLTALFPASRPAAAPSAPASPAALAPVLGGGPCPLVVQQIEGPFYLDLGLIRQDITEGQPGLTTYLIFQVVDAATCAPKPGAVVDVWQNNSQGTYSGFAVKGTLGQTYLRGIQIADANGLVIFKSVYPGWYPGRTTHVHIKVRPDATSEATTQVYFDDWITDLIYANLPPYTLHGPKDTTNLQDGWYTPSMKNTTIPNPDGSLSAWSGMVLGV